MAVNKEELGLRTIQFQGQNAVKLAKWAVRAGTRITRGSVLFHYNDQDMVKKFKGAVVGTIKQLLVTENMDVQPGMDIARYQTCQHAEVMKDLCAECGEDLRQMNIGTGSGNQSSGQSKASVSMIHSVPELKVSVERAEQLGKADEERLLEQRKLVLLVDLDQTIIHTTNENVPNELPDVHHFQLGPTSPWYHTKFRPHTLDFLEKVSKLYELHICTFGARMYAHTIASLLDPSPAKKTFSHRILSRDECLDSSSKSGNLKALFPCGDSMVCIIDDREDVWNFSPNLITVKPYHYFRNTGDINAPFKPDDDENGKSVAANRSKANATAGSYASYGPKSAEKVEDETTPEKPLADGEADKIEVSQSDAKNEDPVEDSAAGLGEKNEACLEMDEATQKTDDNDDAGTVQNSKKSEDEAEKEMIVASEESKAEDSNNTKCDLPEVMETVSTPELITILDDSNGSKNASDQSTVQLDNVASSAATESKESTVSSVETKPVKEKAVESSKGPKKSASLDKNLSKFVCDDDDDYLLYLEDILHRIHDEFFKDYDSKKEHIAEDEHIVIPDLKEIVPRVRKRVLHGVNIVFSGVIPTNLPVEKTKQYTVAKALGANILKDVVFDGSPFERTTHVVAAKHGTAKVNNALKNKKIWIVNPLWLYSCAERWERVEEQLFLLDKDCTDFQPGKNSKLTEEQQKFLSQPARQSFVPAKSSATNTEEEVAVYDPVTGKRIRRQPVEPKPGSSKNSSVESSREADGADEVEPHQMLDFSPLANFTPTDLQLMGKEVDDACSEGDDIGGDSSSSDNDDLDGPPGQNRKTQKRPREVEELSSEESMNAEFPRGWSEKDLKRPKKPCIREMELEDDTRDSFADGARLESDSDSSENQSIGSDLDAEMAADLEREFLGQ